MKRAFPIVLCLLLPVACSSKPVRHLASDAALIQPNVTTRAELHQFLGEPQELREPAPGVKEYVYSENIEGFWGRMPVVNRLTAPQGREMLVITVRDDRVHSVVFRKFDTKDPGWVKKDDGE